MQTASLGGWRSRRRWASYRQAQHLNGSVMGHRWRCNVNNGARYTRLQAWLARSQSPVRPNGRWAKTRVSSRLVAIGWRRSNWAAVVVARCAKARARPATAVGRGRVLKDVLEASYNVTLNGRCKTNAATIEIIKKTMIQCMSQNRNPTSASAYVTVMDSTGEFLGSGRSTG